MYQIVKRLEPGQDLKKEILALLQTENIPSGCILSAVGSLSQAKLRTSSVNGIEIFKEWKEHFEIVSMTGTVSENSVHIHLSIANTNGEVFGGHLVESCITHTTIELAILVFDDMTFSRETDEKTGFKELKVSDKPTHLKLT